MEKRRDSQALKALLGVRQLVLGEPVALVLELFEHRHQGVDADRLLRGAGNRQAAALARRARAAEKCERDNESRDRIKRC